MIRCHRAYRSSRLKPWTCRLNSRRVLQAMSPGVWAMLRCQIPGTTRLPRALCKTHHLPVPGTSRFPFVVRACGKRVSVPIAHRRPLGLRPPPARVSSLTSDLVSRTTPRGRSTPIETRQAGGASGRSSRLHTAVWSRNGMASALPGSSRAALLRARHDDAPTEVLKPC